MVDKKQCVLFVLGMVIAAICGPYAFFALVPDGEPATVDLSTWIEAGKFHVDWALRYDTLAAAEAAIGLALVLVYFRNRGSIQVEDVNLMKG